MLQNTPRKYSLLDPELPLLAIDAAYEIDVFLNEQQEPALKAVGVESNFHNTLDLIHRLSDISTSADTITPDRELYFRSLLPCMEASHINLPTEPSLLSDKLNKIMAELKNKTNDSDLQSVRDFFISLSDFSSNTQRWSRGGASSHPYATL